MNGFWGVAGAIAGGGIGWLFGPVGGFIVGPILGAIISEMLRGRDRVFAYQAGNTTVVAFMGGTIVKLLAAILMIGLFSLRLEGKI